MPAGEGEVIAGPPLAMASPWRRFREALAGSPKGITGLAIVVLILAVAALAPAIAPHDPAAQVTDMRFAPPAWAGGSWSYLLGGDSLGRDIFSRVVVGT